MNAKQAALIVFVIILVGAALYFAIPEPVVVEPKPKMQNIILEPVALDNTVKFEMGSDGYDADEAWWSERKHQEDLDQRRAIRDRYAKEKAENEHDEEMEDFFKMYYSGGWE